MRAPFSSSRACWDIFAEGLRGEARRVWRGRAVAAVITAVIAQVHIILIRKHTLVYMYDENLVFGPWFYNRRDAEDSARQCSNTPCSSAGAATGDYGAASTEQRFA